MPNLWSLMRGKTSEERLSVNDWANMFSFNGNMYPIVKSVPRGSKIETIENDFTGYVKGAYKRNGPIFACMLVRMLIFSEARFQYQRLRDGRPGDLFGKPDLDILEHPWPNCTTGELLSRAIQDVDLSGNHYVLKYFDRKTKKYWLRRLRPDWVDIILTAPADEAVASDVAGYVYRPGGTENKDLWEIYPIDGSKGIVAHWSPIPDPEAQYRGMSWLTPVLREITADTNATTHKEKFFQNAATPNLAVSFSDTVTNEQFKEFMETMDSTKSGVDHAYETLYLGGGADVTVVGSNLQQMDFRNMQGHGETRIAAAARVHPAIVGFAEGMHGSSLNEGNYKAAKYQFGDGTMRPLWRSLCTAYSVLVPQMKDARLWYDDRDIAFLRQDRRDVADIKMVEAQTMSALIQDGYTPESIVNAVIEGDWRLLKHTGLFSVQLQPPGLEATPGQPYGGKNPDGSAKPPPNGQQPNGQAPNGGKPPNGQPPNTKPAPSGPAKPPPPPQYGRVPKPAAPPKG